MNIKRLGIGLIFVGIVLSVVFVGDNTYLVPALTVTMLGFFLALVGFLEDVKKRKEINDQLDDDIVTVIQPLITKYSNMNKNYSGDYSSEDYRAMRLQMNRNLEKELADKLPYLESREIKKIVIEFSREQDKLIK